MKKVISIALVCLCVVGLIFSLASCGASPSKKIIGTWYCENGGWSLDITEDYITYEDEQPCSYFIGNDNTIHIDADGGIDIKYNPDLDNDDSYDEWNYKNGYLYFDGDIFSKNPQDIGQNEKQNDDSRQSNDIQNTDNNVVNNETINPFNGITYEITGISPNCEIMLNTSGCDDLAQQYVNYETDKEYYANGDTVVVKAEISASDYSLSRNTYEIPVSNQPEYISEITKDDISAIKKELEDFISSEVANGVKHGTEGYKYSEVLGAGLDVELKEVSNITPGDIYLQSLKPQKSLQYGKHHNYLTFSYSAAYSGKYGSGHFYSCISAVNIIKYPDGTLKWGTHSPDDYDFECYGSDQSMEYTISSAITVNSGDYNISKV